jgi:predicted nuclease of predicted toxin-antitoxin system
MKKLLLDENLPVRLKKCFSAQFEVYTVKDCGLTSLLNGQLLAEMQKKGFDTLITSDKNIHKQQNLLKFGIRVFVLNSKSNRIQALIPFITPLETALKIERDRSEFVIFVDLT